MIYKDSFARDSFRLCGIVVRLFEPLPFSFFKAIAGCWFRGHSPECPTFLPPSCTSYFSLPTVASDRDVIKDFRLYSPPVIPQLDLPTLAFVGLDGSGLPGSQIGYIINLHLEYYVPVP